jgi:hypothetical protein
MSGSGGARRFSSVECQYVVGTVAEIFANGLTHARSAVGILACGQLFPAKEHLPLSAVDLGVTIPGSLAAARGRREESIDAPRAVALAPANIHPGMRSARVKLATESGKPAVDSNGITMADDDPQQKVLHLLDVLSVGVARGFDRLEGKFDSLEGKFDSLEGKLATLEGKVDAGFERVERRLGNLETRVEGIETEVRGLNGRVTVLEARID